MINLLIFITSPLYNNVKIEVPTNLIKSDLQQLLQAFKQFGHNPYEEKQWNVVVSDDGFKFLFKGTNSFIKLKDESDIWNYKVLDLSMLYQKLYKEIFN